MKRLFLSGPSGCGKTTMIRNALGQRRTLAAGFMTERQLTDTGKIHSFLLGTAGGTDFRTFLDFSNGTPVIFREVFEDAAVLLNDAQNAPFALLDEIGGVELMLPAFREALLAFLTSDTPCIGVLKGPGNGRAMARVLGLPNGYLEEAARLKAFLAQQEDTQILEITGWQDEKALSTVKKWVEEYAHD